MARVPLNYKFQLPPGHLGFFVPKDQQKAILPGVTGSKRKKRQGCFYTMKAGRSKKPYKTR